MRNAGGFATFAERPRVRILPVLCVFAVALLVCAGLTKRHAVSWNDGSRWATVDALAADHTFAIDGSPYMAATGDRIRVRGRTFSDKPPLLALLGAGVASMLQPLGLGLRTTPAVAIYLITLLTVGVWFALGCSYAFVFQRKLGFDERRSAAVAAATGLATLALPYATVLANHVPAGAAGLAGCYHLTFERDRARGLLLGGLFLSLAYAFDPAAVVFAVLAVVLLAGIPPVRLLLFGLALLPVVLAQLAYNVDITGSPLPPVFNAAVWNDRSLPLYQPLTTPVVGFYSGAQYLTFVFDLLLGKKGLFVFTPLAAVCVYGVIVMCKQGAQRRRLGAAIAATCVTLFLLIVFFQNDEVSQNFGERRYVDIFFVACTSLGVAFGAVRGVVAATAVRLAVCASLLIAGLGAIAPFGGHKGQSGFSYATAELGRIALRNRWQAIEDVLGVCLVLVLVLWLMRGAVIGPIAPRVIQERRRA